MATATVTTPSSNNNVTVQNGTDFATGTIPAVRISGTSGGVNFETVALYNDINVILDTSANDGASPNDTITVASASQGLQNFTITTGAGTDAVNINGPVIVAGNLNISTATISVAANVASTGGGNVTLTATNGITFSGAATGVSTTGPITLDSDSDGDGAGTLTIGGSAVLNGPNITLQGADIDVAAGAAVGNAASTNQVTILSSASSRPMSLGGTNNAAVPGINLTSAELARIFTTATGTITFGNTSQTGNITCHSATTATTGGANTVILQSGGGQIVLDNSAGSALNGNGGNISLTAGTGGIVENNGNVFGTADLSTSANVTLNTTGPIGSNTNAINLTVGGQFSATSAAAQYLFTTGAVSLASDNAGANTITLTGGTFNTTGTNAIATTSGLNVLTGATAQYQHV